MQEDQQANSKVITPDYSSGTPSGAAPTTTPVATEANQYDESRISQETQEERPLLSWSAAPIMDEHKSAQWYGGFVVVIVFIAALVYFLTGDFVSTVLVVVAVFGLTFAASRPSGVQQFDMYNDGIQIGQRFYPYQSYKYYAIDDDPIAHSIVLMPLKRFSPALTIPIGHPENIEPITDYLAQVLPHQAYKPDVVDWLMKKIRL